MARGNRTARGNRRAYCIGVDVGGTFTDGVLADGTRVIRAKVTTTPENVGRGVREVCELLARRAGETLENLLGAVSRFGLGTTVVTNILASRMGRRIGLITTKGFETLIPLAKGHQVRDDEGYLSLPPPIVPLERIVGIDERIDRDGNILRPLNPEEVRVAGQHLVEQEKVEALVVSFLWAFRNPTNEQAAVEILRQMFPELQIMSAAALNPIIREFERTSVSLLNAYVGDAFAGIDSLGEELRRAGLRVPVLLVHSGGGSITTEEARHFPIALAASGPAAGVAAAAEAAQVSDVPDVITCDMGGTSFDVAVVSGGIMRRTRGYIMGMWTALSMVDVQSIGAGGGSIGWADARGMLRVGPQSAGAVPGPACYGRGGTEPTVTDALLVLGYLDPAQFLGGEMTLEPELAHAACERLGRAVGLNAEETAWGIREIALQEMVKAVRSLVATRGLDPRAHALLTYGGGGGLFAAEIARAIASPSVLVPEMASVLSAFGCAATDVVRERMRSLAMPIFEDPQLVQKVAMELRADVLRDLEADGIEAAARRVELEADLRFKRQVWELMMPLPNAPLDLGTLEQLESDFRAEYTRRYGSGVMMQTAQVEIFNLRARGIGTTVRASIVPENAGVAQGRPVPQAGFRRVRIERGSAPGDVPTYFGPDLGPGHQLQGPAVIDAVDTTIWVPPHSSVRIDANGTRVMEVAR